MAVIPPSHPGAFDCGGCTACCRHFALGPVSDRIIEGLHAKEIGAHWAPAAQGFAVQRPGPDGQPAWFFTRRDDGGCVFLQPDGLCAIHARFGAEAKPAFCREYPFALVEEGPRMRIFVRGDCGGWSESFSDGTEVEAQIEAIAALPRVHPTGQLSEGPLVILPGLGLAPDSWPTVEAHLVPILAEPGPIEQRVGEACQALFALVGREPPEAFGPRVPSAIAHVHARLHAALSQALSAPKPDGPESPEVLEIRGMRAFLAEAEALLSEAAPGLPSGPRDMRLPRELDETAQDYLALLLRHQVHGLTFQDLRGLPAWLGSMVVGVRIAASAVPGDHAVSARELGPRLATWIRLTRHVAVRRLLQDLTPVLEDIFVHAEDA